jgi:cytochrome P450
MALSVPVLPTHVPPHLVRDVDPYHMLGDTEDPHRAWKRIQDENPEIYYTSAYGGYWVLNRASLLDEVWPDHERFASSGAIAIPPLPAAFPRQLPIEADPPEHRYFRLPLSMALSPKRVQLLRDEARALAIELIEGFQPRGECEFMQEFAMHLPMTIFLRLIDLPSSDRLWLIARAHVMARDADEIRRGHAFTEILEYLDRWVRERIRNPGNDLISEVARIKIGDRPITHSEILGECSTALFGGLDTVAGTMGFFARFLAESPAHRQQLAETPELIPQAIEELLRRFSIPMVSRRVTRDLELREVQMKAGDLVILETCLHGMDETSWPESLKVDFGRRPSEHVAFGKGAHKCPGANLARAELRVFLEEWLKRIPNFSIRAGETPVTASGAVMTVVRLPLQWLVAT